MSPLEMIVTAAAQMRGLADAAEPGDTWFRAEALARWQGDEGLDETFCRHIAAWSPQMARKVADLLDEAAVHANEVEYANEAAFELAKIWLGVADE